MPSKENLKKILVIGAGPTVVGHGTEYNLAAWIACRLPREKGITVVALDSNPASLALESDSSDVRYVEPLTACTVRKIIEKERPDAILPIAGGQTALTLCSQAADCLRANGVAVLGLSLEAIESTGDRLRFAELAVQAGGTVLPSAAASSPEEAAAAASKIGGFPVVLRPFFVVAGTGSSVVYNLEELKENTFRAIKHSPVKTTLVEHAALGWKEVICQVLRDRDDNAAVAGIIETIDPMGVHTGDSAAVFPAQSLSKKQLETVSALACSIARKAGIEGSADIEFAIDPRDPDNVVVMEMNPYISRCSAMISFATGFSTIEAAVRLALGEPLSAVCPEPLEPKAVAVRVPRFSFEKFPSAKLELNTSMKSVGEAMALGGTFREAFQKALREPIGGRDGFGFDGRDILPAAEDPAELRRKLSAAQPGNYYYIKPAMDSGMCMPEIAAATGIDRFFLKELSALLETARSLQRHELSAELLRKARSEGFSISQIATITGRKPDDVAVLCAELKVQQTWRAVGANVRIAAFNEHAATAPPADSRPVMMMIGPGPNEIGTGSEYEFCVSRAAKTFRELGYRCVAVNCSVQGPSSEPSQWDELYLVPLCPEEVLAVARTVKPAGVSVQFGGPVSIKLSETLVQNGFRIQGTSPESHRRCHSRSLRREMLNKLRMLQPKDGTIDSLEAARNVAAEIGYPVVVKSLQPTHGKAMEVVYNEADLDKTVKDFLPSKTNGVSLLISEFLEDAIEIEAEAVADGESILIAGIVEHIEEAGIHSGDSACAIPPYTVGDPTIAQMREQAAAIATELGVCGLLNVQFAIKNDLIYVIDLLPSASLTVPFVRRAADMPLVSIAAKATAGVSLKQQGFTRERLPQQMAVRHSVFPFARFPGVDTVLGPEMKSTGRVMGVSDTFGLAFAKAAAAAGQDLPLGGQVFISLKNKDKRPMLFIAKKLEELGFKLIATRGTAATLTKNDVKVELISKVSEGRPNVVDLIKNGQVNLIINTPSRKTPSRDEVSIRSSAVAHNVPLITTVSGASAAVNAIEMTIKRGMEVRSR